MEENTNALAKPTDEVSASRLRCLRYQMLTLLWSFPSVGAGLILYRSYPHWQFGQGILAGLQSCRIEDWIAALILAAHVLWILRWRRSASVPTERRS